MLRFWAPDPGGRFRVRGKARKRASERFDADWMAQQRNSLTAVLPDAGYIDQDDEAGLLSILTCVHDEPEGTIAPLAPPSLVIVVDEFAALIVELLAFVDDMVNVAQCGRSLGVDLILATQRPTGVIRNSRPT